MPVPLTVLADVRADPDRSVSNIKGDGGSDDVDFGFLIGDVNAGRTVTKPDANQIKRTRVERSTVPIFVTISI
jgi:hypothetical protein